MCHADTHPFFFATKRNIVKALMILFGLQLACIFYIIYINQKTISTFNTSLAIYPYNLKSLKLYVADPLLKTSHTNHISNYDIFSLKDTSTTRDYFTKISDQIVCYTLGTNISASWDKQKCVCITNQYFGNDCGIPSVIWNTGNNSQLLPMTLKRRNLPRRIIMGVYLDDEFDMFETRMSMQYDVVDTFILQEGNVSIYGVPKEPLFLHRFQQGWLKQCQDKFVYVYQSSVPEQEFKDVDDARSFQRKFLGKTAFLRRLTDLRPDDIFVYSEPEELIRPEILLFLKLYNGYSEPISFRFRHSIFGYFWTIEVENFGSHHMLLQNEELRPSAASLALFRDFYKYDASFPGFNGTNKRNILASMDDQNAIELKKTELAKEDFESRNGVKVNLLNIADDAGWKCSWCYEPENIRNKLLSIPPKYLDMVSLMIQENSELENIRGFIKYGVYFDKSFMRGGKGTELSRGQDVQYAPTYIQNNFERFSYLLVNPYEIQKPTLNENATTSTTIAASQMSNHSIVDALDNKIKKYWYSLFDNSSITQNHKLVAAIDQQFKNYWNSVREKLLPGYIKMTQK